VPIQRVGAVPAPVQTDKGKSTKKKKKKGKGKIGGVGRRLGTVKQTDKKKKGWWGRGKPS